jgi:enediyne polyketide synthase
MPAEQAPILVAGTACRFPDADNPDALMRNTMEGRLSFRLVPKQRLALEDYEAGRIGEADSITPVPAGLIGDWRFDAQRFRTPRTAFEAADLTHWLALEVAADALLDAGGAEVVDRGRTAVVVANTLTGEFTRTAQLRLRWPWLDRALSGALADAGLDEQAASRVRGSFRERLHSALRAPDEESLAGGLANTIAGRIANQLDLHGGAFSVDAACASSLVAVATAAELIASGEADAAIVAAVDLSLDPFELVGFSRNGALARNRMRVFDARAEGFWPGEGAGAIVLMNRDAARRRGVGSGLELAGWAVATDGSGGLTRPDAAGQRRALDRAYARARIDPAELGFVEAHGTGTAVGDPTEIRALSGLIAGTGSPALPIASVKANIGHTKAAAGLAGLIRTAECIKAGLVPPHAGCERLHPVFAETGHRLRVPVAPEAWRAGSRRVAGVSGFGFGGVNAHVVLTAAGAAPARAVPPAPASRECELFLFRANEAAVIAEDLRRLGARAPSLSYAELADAAADAAARLGQGPLALAFRASSPADLAARTGAALAALDGSPRPGIRIGRAERRPRLGLVFPGQAAPVRPGGGAWLRRFPGRYAASEAGADLQRTDEAQPAIVKASLAGLDLLARLGIAGDAAIGHSLGELAALTWAGSIEPDRLAELAAERGRAMNALEPGAMLRLGCSAREAEDLTRSLDTTLACLNAPDETIHAGPFPAVDALEQRARAAGIDTLRLPVSHAFHSPMMAGAEGPLRKALGRIGTGPPGRPVVSTVTGKWLTSDTGVEALLVAQLTRPVLFAEAAGRMASAVDLAIEVGPGAGLSRILAGMGREAFSLDVFADDIAPLFDALAEIFVRGVSFDPMPLFDTPEVRPLRARPPVLLSSPCGLLAEDSPITRAPPPDVAPAPPAEEPLAAEDPLALLVRLLAEETGLPTDAISPEDRFLDDLHLNSLAVTRLAERLGRAFGRRLPGFRTAFANAKVVELAEAIEAADDDAQPRHERPAGVARWVRRFTVARLPLMDRPSSAASWHRTTLDEAELSPADGIAIELGPWEPARDAARLLRLCQQAAGTYRMLALCHSDAPLSGFARSIAAEGLFDSVRLIPASRPDLLERHVFGFEEILLDEGGRPGVAGLAIAGATAGPVVPPGAVLVTGGARGVAAECAIRLAERYRSPLILVGRTGAGSPDVEQTLARVRSTGAPVRYVAADVTDAAALADGVARAASEIGPVTHLVHAAGVNEPAALTEIGAELLERTLAPKTLGLAAAVEAAGDSLVRIVAFGSIIGRLGLAGEAHYALANAQQARMLAGLQAARPGLSTLSIDWSVWGGVGMGERLGALERLEAAGVDPISLDDALDQFEALATSSAEGSLIVTSRFGADSAPSSLPHRRFLERVLVHTPDVETVVEARIGHGRDPYLLDHLVDGAAVVPGVMLLEAMAQAARTLVPEGVLSFEDVRFSSAVQISGEGRIRVAVLREADGAVRAEVRDERDGFAVPCAGAVLRAREAASPPSFSSAAAREGIPAAPLYGPLFFHGPAFQRLATLGSVASRTVSGTFDRPAPRDWFGPFEPQTLELGDPGSRDAALHALQACVPHGRLVPVSVGRIERNGGGDPASFEARELWCSGDDYAFEIVVADAEGRVVERWLEAVFRRIGAVDVAPVLAAAPSLAQAYLERRARELTGEDALRLALVDDPAATRSERRARVTGALGLGEPPARRGDGKRVLSDGSSISFSHSGSVTIGICAPRSVGCDLESTAGFDGEADAEAWTAEEVLRKLGSRMPLRALDQGFTGADGERIVPLGTVPTGGGGSVTVTVGRAS